MPPEGVAGGKWLWIGNIKHRSPDLPSVERVQQIVVLQMAATPGID